jgi:hypothetical protein
MQGCPACGRPVAMVRPRCLYCGGALPQDALEAAEVARAETIAPAPGLPPAPTSGEARTLLVLHTSGADPRALADALTLSAYEAGQRVVRGGYQLLKVLEPAAAEAEAARLRGHGLTLHLLPEARVREARAARLATGGGLRGGALVLQTAEAEVAVAAGDVVLVVKGPIAREYQAAAEQGGLTGTRNLRRLRTATLDNGYRFHLHMRQDVRPLELDPAAFSFGEDALGASSMLQITSLVAAVSAEAPVDDDFRRQPPAFAPAVPVAGPLAAADALRGGNAARNPILDNVIQFRDYSSWRGTVERLRREA